jgi:hypothetical protein
MERRASGVARGRQSGERARAYSPNLPSAGVSCGLSASDGFTAVSSVARIV